MILDFEFLDDYIYVKNNYKLQFFYLYNFLENFNFFSHMKKKSNNTQISNNYFISSFMHASCLKI